MSGQRPRTHGGFEVSTATLYVCSKPDTAPTLPYYFKQNGYETQSFGKLYHSIVNYPGAGWSIPPWTPNLHWSYYVNSVPAKTDGQYQPAIEIYQGPSSLHGDYQITSKVIQALKTTGGKPFCIFAGLHKPHLPFVAPQKYWDLYRNIKIHPLEPTAAPLNSYKDCYRYTELWSYGLESKKGRKTLYSAARPPNPNQTLDLTRAYYACVSFADAQVGRLLDTLKELGLEDSTAVVLWGDHGFHLGDQERWGKNTQFETDMRSPLMIRLPGTTLRPGASDALVETVDIYPTLADYCDLPIPPHTEGVSLVPIISGEKNKVKTSALSEFLPFQGPFDRLPNLTQDASTTDIPYRLPFMIYSLRNDNYRYIQWRDRNQKMKVVREELYDLRNTEYETTNIAGLPSHSAELQKLRNLMKSEHPDY